MKKLSEHCDSARNKKKISSKGAEDAKRITLASFATLREIKRKYQAKNVDGAKRKSLASFASLREIIRKITQKKLIIRQL